MHVVRIWAFTQLVHSLQGESVVDDLDVVARAHANVDALEWHARAVLLVQVHLQVCDRQMRLHHDTLHLVPTREDDVAVGRTQLLGARDGRDELPAVGGRAVAVCQVAHDRPPVRLELLLHVRPVLRSHRPHVLPVVERLAHDRVVSDGLLGEDEHRLVLDRELDGLVAQLRERRIRELFAVRLEEEGLERRDGRGAGEPLLGNRDLGLEGVLALERVIVAVVLQVERGHARLVHAVRDLDLGLRQPGSAAAVRVVDAGVRLAHITGRLGKVRHCGAAGGVVGVR